MIDKNEIIRVIAERDRIFISPEDPILAVFVIHDLLLEESAKAAAAIMQKKGEDFVANVRVMMERQQEWVKNENESSFKYHGQIVRDAQIKFDRSIDETIDTIRKLHLEIAQMKASSWTAATATIIIMVLGFCAAATMNILH